MLASSTVLDVVISTDSRPGQLNSSPSSVKKPMALARPSTGRNMSTGRTMTRSAAAALAQKQEHALQVGVVDVVAESSAAHAQHVSSSNGNVHQHCNGGAQAGTARHHPHVSQQHAAQPLAVDGAGGQPQMAGLVCSQPPAAACSMPQQGLLRTGSMQRGSSSLLAENAALLQQLMAQEGHCGGLLDDSFLAAIGSSSHHHQSLGGE